MNFDHIAFGLQIVSCLFMCGVISVIQLIHYPSFADIERSRFITFHANHSQALGWIAGPAMCLELVSSLYLARTFDFGWILNLISVLSLWVLTFAVSVPRHQKLTQGFDEDAYRELVSTNRLRTALWLARGVLLTTWLLGRSL